MMQADSLTDLRSHCPLAWLRALHGSLLGFIGPIDADIGLNMPKVTGDLYIGDGGESNARILEVFG